MTLAVEGGFGHGLRSYLGPSRCRCEVCRSANTAHHKRYVVTVARQGGLMWLDATETARRLHEIREAAGSWVRVGELLGVSTQAAWHLANRRRRCRRETAAAVERLWEDHCAPVVKRRWPVGPLRDELCRSYGALTSAPLSSADRRYLYRAETLDTARADRVCLACGLFPEWVWEDWYSLEPAR